MDGDFRTSYSNSSSNSCCTARRRLDVAACRCCRQYAETGGGYGRVEIAQRENIHSGNKRPDRHFDETGSRLRVAEKACLDEEASMFAESLHQVARVTPQRLKFVYCHAITKVTMVRQPTLEIRHHLVLNALVLLRALIMVSLVQSS